MPLYEYHCEACGNAHEQLESLSAPLEHDCPSCGANHGMKRQISVPVFSLNGGGWYAQGYDKGKPESAKESPAPAKAETGGCCGGCACHTPSAS